MSLNFDRVNRVLKNKLRYIPDTQQRYKLRVRMRTHLTRIHNMEGNAARYKKYFQEVRNEATGKKMSGINLRRGKKELQTLRNVFTTVYPLVQDQYQINTQNKVFRFHVDKISKELRNVERIQLRISGMNYKPISFTTQKARFRSLRDAKKELSAMKRKYNLQSWNLQNKMSSITENHQKALWKLQRTGDRKKAIRKLEGVKQRLESKLKTLGKRNTTKK